MRQTNSAMARELIRFSLPLILSGILQQLYSWADAFIVGHSGPEGERMLAAVGATGTLTGFIINMLMGFTLGLSILAAQEFGRGNRDKIRGIMSCYLPLFFIVIAIITGIASFLVEPILRLMSTPAEIFTYAGSYLRLILIGVPVLAVYNLVAAVLRAVGNTKAAFYAVLLSSGLNVVLDILLVLVWQWGVKGAALATVLSQIAMTAFIIGYLWRQYPEIAWRRKGEPLFDRAVLRRGAGFGMPPMIRNSINSFGSLVLQNFMNQFGASIILAITTAYRVDSIMLLPIGNLGAAVSSMTARAEGEGNREKANACLRTGLLLMIVIAVTLTLIMYFCGGSFIAFFGVTGDALAAGRRFFRDLALFYVLCGIGTILRSVLEGQGDLIFCSVVGILELIFRIGASYALRPVAGSRTIAFAEGLSWVFALLLVAARFCYRRHRKQQSRPDAAVSASSSEK